MRALIGLLVLGCLFIMAASWQNRTTSDLQSRRSLRYVAPADSADTDTAGWSRLIFGRPSGSEPLPLPEPPPALSPGAVQGQPYGTGSDPSPMTSRTNGRTGQEPGSDPSSMKRVGIESTIAPRYARDFEYVVRANDSLGIICQKHYDERPLHKLVEAVSLYNDLKSPNAIRSGDTILLPDAAVLFPDR
jgi:hypothetical protein